MRYVDLHNHTTASDGLLTPAQLVKWGAQKGLVAIGVTDHDTTDGIQGAIEAGRGFGVEIVPGIELSTQIGDNEIHMLGYYIDIHSIEFQEEIEELKEDRYSRSIKMIDKLRQIYKISISLEEVMEKSGNRAIARPHIGRVLVDKGIVKDLNQAFEIYIGNDCPAYVPRKNITPKQGIEIIKKAGGVPVLAHPGLIKNQSLIEDIIHCGIKGIEVYHSKHTSRQSAYLKTIADKNCLIVTGGSDCHGDLIDGKPIIGDIKVGYSVVEKLKNAASNN
jgi:predicted metal-dependent phosphoesterase TrpH